MDNIPDIVDLVLWGLAAMSAISWAILIYKILVIRRNDQRNRYINNVVSVASNLDEIKASEDIMTSGFGRMVSQAQTECATIRQNASMLDARDRREMLFHAMRQVIHDEKTRLENGLAVLASVGSTAPFVGLFGTVWGIMNALKSITASGSAGLDVVAGPIGEALIATAMGIAAAIPAVLAYNYFLRRVHRAVTGMDHFADKLLHLAIRTGI